MTYQQHRAGHSLSRKPFPPFPSRRHTPGFPLVSLDAPLQFSFLFLPWPLTTEPSFSTLEVCVRFPPGLQPSAPTAQPHVPFLFFHYNFYSFTVINHSHDDNYMMNAVSPPSESLSAIEFG